jgi:hypothetical protein
MNKQNYILFYIINLIGLLLTVESARAHHYKGLPHNNYFENYPQVPTLEFLHEDDKWEIFLTVFNFQGINLESVEDNDMVRFYIFLYDLKADKVYRKTTRMDILSRGKVVYSSESHDPEEESIYSIHQKLKYQDELELHVHFKDSDGIVDVVKLPFRIKKTFFQKYGLIFVIFIFFVFVGILKKYLEYVKEKNLDSNA